MGENKCCGQEATCCSGKKGLAIFLKTILGLGFLVLGSLAILKFWPELILIAKGFIGLFLILAGVIILALAKE